MRTFNERWYSILRQFNWVTVLKALDWRCEDPDEPPTIGELIITAEDVCHTAHEKGYCATGGFQAEYDKDDDVLTLHFVVETRTSE